MLKEVWGGWTRVRRWLLDGVWDYDITSFPLGRRVLFRALRILSLVWRGVAEDACQTRAWALSSITLLSIVPLLAFVFSLGLGHGVRSVVEDQLRAFFPLPQPVVGIQIPASDQLPLVTRRLEINAVGNAAYDRGEDQPLSELRSEVLSLVRTVRDELETERRTLIGDPAPAAVMRRGEIQEILDSDTGRQADIAMAELALLAARRENEPETRIKELEDELRTQREGIDVVDTILSYVDRTPVQALGVLGFIILFWTLLKVLGTVESFFNEIWGVQSSRAFYRKFTDYVSVSVVGLLALVLASTLNVALRTGSVAQWVERTLHSDALTSFATWIMPTFMTCLGFAFAYFVMPNTSVRIDSAALGGFFAGILFQLSQWGFIHFQIGVSRYNALYGAFATFPLIVFWLYVAWLITLVGAEVAFAHEHEATYAQERHAAAASVMLSERVALEVAVQVAKRFQQGLAPLTTDEIAGAVDVPVRLVRQVAWILTEQGILVSVAGREGGIAPARSLDAITVAQVVEAIRIHGDSGPELDSFRPEVTLVLKKYRNALQSSLGTMTLKELAASQPA